MAKPMTLAQLINHVVTQCPTRTDKALPFLEDHLGRFQMQAYRRGYRAAVREQCRAQDVFDNAG